MFFVGVVFYLFLVSQPLMIILKLAKKIGTWPIALMPAFVFLSVIFGYVVLVAINTAVSSGQ